MLAEVATTAALSVSAYFVMRYFFNYKIVRVIVAGSNEPLRRAVTDRLLLGGKPLGGNWPEIMTDSTRHKCDIGQDEYTFLELRGHPANHFHILDHFDVVIFVVDCAAKDSLELFGSSMRLGPLKNTKFMIYAVMRNVHDSIYEKYLNEFMEFYSVGGFTQKWHVQPVDARTLDGIEDGMSWVKSVV